MAAIEATNLTKVYDDIVAVDGLSLSIDEGSVYGFLGPNGAGKTTTMRLLTALTEPTEGTATVAGLPVTDRPALTERVGYLPAEPPVFDELTGREYLRYVARLHELDGEEAQARIDGYLDRFDLDDDAHRRISEYSTGMRKKVGAIGAVLHEPAVLFLDEPTSGLDPRAARIVRETITELADQEMTVFLSTHILSVVEELADVIGVIHEGQLVTQGDPDVLSEQAEGGGADLESVFLEVTRECDTEDHDLTAH